VKAGTADVFDAGSVLRSDGSNHATTLRMGSLIWLGLTAVFVVGIVLTGHTPKGGKPVARTRLMGTARSMLVVGAVAFGILGLWGALRP
jgi:hypothetical protein